MPTPKPPLSFILVVGLVGIGLLTYSQLVAYWGDESLHLVAAQLIVRGRRPYLDFFYHHTPLFAYLAAGLMSLFGENWRVVHLFSALASGGSVLLVGGYVYSRAKNFAWGRGAAVIAAMLLGLNSYVISFGTVGLPYGLCLFAMVAAFFFTVESVKRESGAFALGAGVSAGAAAASYLLTAPLLPILLLWLIQQPQKGSRAFKTCAYLIGAVIPFVPFLWLASHSPRQVWFDMVQYHLFHRAGRDLGFWFNFREIAGWFVSIQGLMLIGFGVLGLLTSRRQGFDDQFKSELRLCLWSTFGLILLIAIARPVSAFYFVLITPLAAIPAAFGIVGLHFRTRGKLLCIALVFLYLLGLSSQRYIWRWQTAHADHHVVKEIAEFVDEVTPPAGMIYAFEAVYFEAKRLPPPGLENRFNPESKADEWLSEGRFDTVCIGSTNPRLREFKLLERYQMRRSFSLNGYDFYVLWNRSATSSNH